MTPWVELCAKAIRHTHETSYEFGRMVERGTATPEAAKVVIEKGIDIWISIVKELFNDTLGIMGVRLATYEICRTMSEYEPFMPN